MSESSPSHSDNSAVPGPVRAFGELREGQRLPELRMAIDRARVIRFAGAVDDYARPHWDHEFMVASGMPGVIVHGWLTFSVMCRVVQNWIPMEIADYTAFSVRYVRPNLPGTAVYGAEVRRKIDDADGRRAEIAIWADNEQGQRLAEGSITTVFA